jgi:hypothetical protein
VTLINVSSEFGGVDVSTHPLGTVVYEFGHKDANGKLRASDL